jgi:uncharacterized membrane protein YeaQ/YmgE (transglycosylase-associated protein family)
MDIIMWVLTGAALGWVGYAFLGLNRDRGLVISIIIGTVGGVLGGKVLAPLFSAPAAAAGEANLATVLFAAAVATAALIAGNLLHRRWGV